MSGNFDQNEIPIREIFQSPGPSNGVGNNHGSAARTSVTVGLPPTAAGSLSHIEGQTFNVPQAAAGSLGTMQTEYPLTPPTRPQMAFLQCVSSFLTPLAKGQP